METFEIPVSIKCGACNEAIRLSADTPDDQVVICSSCGTEVGASGAIRAAAMKLVRKQAVVAAKKAMRFKR